MKGTFAALLALTAALSQPRLGRAQQVEPFDSGGGRFELGLHARSMQASARVERAAFITLNVPLGKLSSPAHGKLSSSRSLAQLGTAATEAARPTDVDPVIDQRITLEQLRALSDFSRRATVVALSVVGTAAARRRLDALDSRARSSALLPELRLRALRNSDQALRWIPSGDDPYRITQANGTGLILEASATFRLDRLLFAHEELAIARLRHEAGEERSKLEARVLEAVLGLFRERELGCADQREEAMESAQRAVKLLELLVELDGLTAGWFSEQAATFGRAVWGFPEAALGQCSPPGAVPPATPTNPVASLEDSE